MNKNTMQQGDTIGIIATSHIAEKDVYTKIIRGIESKGFRVKTGEALYKSTYGYLASEMERADDLNNMVMDRDVKMIFFGGGCGAVDLLPLIDYDAISQHPKYFLSYSDGTSILNAIYSQTGIATYYGQSPGGFADLSHYDDEQFDAHFLKGDPTHFVSNSEWHTLCQGCAEGVLVGGYLLNFALLTNSRYFHTKPQEKYLLFLEDCERYNSVAGVSMLLSHIEQSSFVDQVSGLLFGHYSETIYPDLMGRLRRFGEKHGIPVVYCDDFGHGKNHAVLPIGGYARLNTGDNSMQFRYP